MPTAQYTALANVTLTGTSSSVTFSSFTTGFRDLFVVFSCQATSVSPRLRFNSDTGTNYNEVFAYGDGSTAAGYAVSNQAYIDFSIFGMGNGGMVTAHIMDFSSTNKHKPVLIRDNYTVGSYVGADMLVGRWANTAAITSLTVYAGSGSFASGSSFALYGVK